MQAKQIIIYLQWLILLFPALGTVIALSITLPLTK